MKLQGRTVLITGGTSGIGLELARRLLERGNTVAVTGRDSAKLDEVRRSLPAIHVFQSDVGDPAAIAALHADVLMKLPALDVLVNNAGILRNLDLNDPRDLADVAREIEINLRGPIQMTQQFLTHLKTRGDALIVNVSSVLAFIPFAMSPIYSAAKAGIHAFTQCLRVQLAGSGVAVVELVPPGTETPLFRRAFAHELMGQRRMDVKILVEKAIAGIESGEEEIRPGLANVLKTMSRLAPQFMFNQLTKMTRPEGNRKVLKPKNAG